MNRGESVSSRAKNENMKLKKFLILTALASGSGALHADEESISNGFFVEGDFLYWNAHISGLELTGGTSSIVVETLDDTTTTYMQELDVDPPF